MVLSHPTTILCVALVLALLGGCAHGQRGGGTDDDARQTFEAAQRAQAEGSTRVALEAYTRLARREPWSWWGRRSLEELDRSFTPLSPDAHEAALLKLQAPGNTGQLLFYSARAQASANPRRAIALGLLLLETDPGSPYRSQCEDLTLTLLPADADRLTLLEDWLVPGRQDDPASFYDGRRQAQELELATLYLKTGRRDQAREHLLNCVNRYESARLKDDALLLLSQATAKGKERHLCGRALAMLVEDYPHSRHLEEARRRLETGYCEQ